VNNIVYKPTCNFVVDFDIFLLNYLSCVYCIFILLFSTTLMVNKNVYYDIRTLSKCKGMMNFCTATLSSGHGLTRLTSCPISICICSD